jgi:hypothetical protein
LGTPYFWTQGRRAAAAAIVREEFEDIFKEELPIREGPEVDTTKNPATIRFEDSYDGETLFRKGIKMAPRELQLCREQLLELLQKGYIGPSASPFGAPILMVPKPNDPTKLRMVVDYHAINALTQSDRYPLPKDHNDARDAVKAGLLNNRPALGILANAHARGAQGENRHDHTAVRSIRVALPSHGFEELAEYLPKSHAGYAKGPGLLPLLHR